MRVSLLVLVIACAVAANACDPQFVAIYEQAGFDCSPITQQPVVNPFSSTPTFTQPVGGSSVVNPLYSTSTFTQQAANQPQPNYVTGNTRIYGGNQVYPQPNYVTGNTGLNYPYEAASLYNSASVDRASYGVNSNSNFYPVGSGTSFYSPQASTNLFGTNYGQASNIVGTSGSSLVTPPTSTNFETAQNPCNGEDPPVFCDFQTVEPFDYTFPEISWPSAPSSSDVSVFGSSFTNGGSGLDLSGDTPVTVDDEIYDYYDYYNYLTFADDTVIPFGTAVSNPSYNPQTAYSNFNYNPYEAASLYNSASVARASYGVNSNPNFYPVGTSPFLGTNYGQASNIVGTSFNSPQNTVSYPQVISGGNPQASYGTGNNPATYGFGTNVLANSGAYGFPLVNSQASTNLLGTNYYGQASNIVGTSFNSPQVSYGTGNNLPTYGFGTNVGSSLVTPRTSTNSGAYGFPLVNSQASTNLLGTNYASNIVSYPQATYGSGTNVGFGTASNIYG